VCRLQLRLEALHEGGLLSDDELGSLEDTVADCYEFKAALPQGVATLELIHTNPQATKAFKLVSSRCRAPCRMPTRSDRL